MTVKCHKLVLLLIVVCECDAVEVRVDGEVSISFDNRMPRAQERQPLKHMSNVTVPPIPECLYQYPEKKQLESLLSNMMNELTKVFVRAHQLVTHQANRTAAHRFRVTSKKNFHFFEEVFQNMTRTYRQFYKRTMSSRPPPSDPCTNQEKLKDMWSDLIESSLQNLRKAVLQCIAEYLRVQNRSNDGRTRRKLGQLLNEEFNRVRDDQLGLLCDNFQLCYSDLL